MEAVLVEQLSKSFKSNGQETLALQNISFSVEKGEFLSIVGPNGCGKTTLLKIIAGFIQDFNGDVTILEKRLDSFGVSIILQNLGLFDWMTVQENIAFVLRQKKDLKERAGELTRTYLESVGLQEFENHYPSQLSGGMRQKLAIARALASNEKIILMDEPFSSLDYQTKEKLQEELGSVFARTKKTVVFVTHDLDEAIYLSDRVLVLSDRPARIIQEIIIDLPRPRLPEIRTEKRFQELKAQLWLALRERTGTQKNKYAWRVKKWN